MLLTLRSVAMRDDAIRCDAMRGRKLPPILLLPRKAFRSSLSREHRERKLKFHAIVDDRALASRNSIGHSVRLTIDRSIDREIDWMKRAIS